MSMQSAVAFYERMESDQQFQEQLVARSKELGTPERIAAYVKDELGYEFTQEEMQKVIYERKPELTDEELEAVTGGSAMLGVLLVMAGAPAWIGFLVAAA